MEDGDGEEKEEIREENGRLLEYDFGTTRIFSKWTFQLF